MKEILAIFCLLSISQTVLADDLKNLTSNAILSFSMDTGIVKNHVRIAQLPQNTVTKEEICYYLGRLGSSANQVGTLLKAMKIPEADMKQVIEFDNYAVGAISFCSEGFIAIPVVDDGSVSPYAVNFGDVKDLDAHLQKMDSISAVLQKYR